MVRSHRNVAGADLCKLFALTEVGRAAILDGADWRTEFSTAEEHMSRIAEHYLGDTPAKYPERPGFTEPTTSKEAADRIAPRAGGLRERVLAAIKAAGMAGLTADEAARAARLTVLATRPRVTELLERNEIVHTGEYRKNESGARAGVWRAK